MSAVLLTNHSASIFFPPCQLVVSLPSVISLCILSGLIVLPAERCFFLPLSSRRLSRPVSWVPARIWSGAALPCCVVKIGQGAGTYIL